MLLGILSLPRLHPWLNLSFYRLDEAFGYTIEIDVAPEGMRPKRIGCVKEIDAEILWKVLV